MKKKHHIIFSILFYIFLQIGFFNSMGCGITNLGDSLSDFPYYAPVSDYVVTPNGDKVIYSTNVDVDLDVDIYSTDINAHNPTSLLNNLYTLDDSRSVTDLQDSPNSAYVTFGVRDDTSNDLYSVSMVDSTYHDLAVVASSDDIIQPTLLYEVTPNSETVVFISEFEEDDHPRLYSVPIDGGTVTCLSTENVALSDPSVTDFEISKDSTQVVFLGGDQVYSVSIHGGSVTNITADSDTSYSAVAPITLADNDWLAFVATEEGVGSADLFAKQLNEPGIVDLTPDEFPLKELNYVIHKATGVVAYEGAQSESTSAMIGVTIANQASWVIDNSIALNTTMTFSEDGSKIYYLESNSSLSIIDTAGGTPMILLSDLEQGEDSDFALTADNEYILYIANYGEVLKRVTVATGTILDLATTSDDLDSNFYNLLISSDSQYVVLYGDPEESANFGLYSVPLAGGERVKLSD